MNKSDPFTLEVQCLVDNKLNLINSFHQDIKSSIITLSKNIINFTEESLREDVLSAFCKSCPNSDCTTECTHFNVFKDLLNKSSI